MTSTLFISLPARAAVETRPDWPTQPLPFAWFGADGRLQQQGQQTLAELKQTAAGVHKLCLLLAGCDVSLLHTTVPPMSAAKLRQALPNLLEEQLIGDPAGLVLAAGSVVDGACSVAVADKAWMETLAGLVKDWGVRQIAAYPAYLLLTDDEAGAGAVALVEEGADQLELELRSGPVAGLGLTLAAGQHAPEAVLQTLGVMLAGAPATVFVAAQHQAAYQQAAQTLADPSALRIKASNWHCRTCGAQQPIDLMSGVAASHKPAFDFAAWRWPLRLAAALLLVNLAALNFEWFSLKREAQTLQDSVTQTFRNSFPKEQVILDPLAQMQQKVNAARRLAGQATEDDFTSLATRFALAWERVAPGGATALAALEYKDRSLLVKPKSGQALPLDALRTALAAQALDLQPAADGVLQIRNGAKK